MQLINLTCDYRIEPIDIGWETPVFGFGIESNGECILEQEWQIQVSRDPEFADCVWDSGKQKTPQNAGIRYAGGKLCSRTRYYWRIFVTVWPQNLTLYGESFFETTLLSQKEWRAPFISQNLPVTGSDDHAIWMRRKFSVTKTPVCARLYITAKGIYKAQINGNEVTDALLTPGFTTYYRNLLFQTYDVSELFLAGENEFTVHLAYGWYGRLGNWPGQTPYADQPSAVSAQIWICYADGTEDVIITDDSWEWRYSRIVSSNIYNGEIVGILEDPSWRPVKITGWNEGQIYPHDGNLVKRGEVFAPVREIRTPKGEQVFDFGQNLSGFVRIRVQGKRGDKVRIRHAELLDRDGNFYTGNLRGAKQVLEYTMDRDGEQEYEPQFTFYGFRYICVDQFPGKARPEHFTVQAIYSDLPATLEFSCSDKRIEKLVQNASWGMKSNYVDIPTDCPQRDERLGWTGDSYSFCNTGAYFMRTPLFYRKWLHDMREGQYPDGALPNTIPDMFNAHDTVNESNRNCHSAAGWAEAAILCPYIQYLFFGDYQILADNFDMMRKFMDYVAGRCRENGLWEGDEQFGDWLGLDAYEGSYKGATPEDYIASAFYAGACRLMSEICRILGKTVMQQSYIERYEQVKDAFISKYFDENQELLVDTQTACVLALEFGVSPKPQKTADKLADMIVKNDGKLTTGFLGTRQLCQMLFDHGYQELAVALLHQEEYPSWLHTIELGATTIWEHWDGIRADGSLWSDDMNSFNHYSYGNICTFIFSRLAGLRADENAPGFARMILQPWFVKQWEYCRLKYRSVKGDIEIGWKREGKEIRLEVSIPPVSQAEMRMPDGRVLLLNPGRHEIKYPEKEAG